MKHKLITKFIQSITSLTIADVSLIALIILIFVVPIIGMVNESLEHRRQLSSPPPSSPTPHYVQSAMETLPPYQILSVTHQKETTRYLIQPNSFSIQHGILTYKDDKGQKHGIQLAPTDTYVLTDTEYPN